MMNAQSARTWFLQHGAEADAAASILSRHRPIREAVNAFGIDPANMFPFWDWVGGRYSIWSAIGLPVALAVGFDTFSDFLAGAHAMDEHFRTAPLEQNMPALLALIGFWYRNFFGSTSVSIAPYHQDLNSSRPTCSSSTWKATASASRATARRSTSPTCPVIWGDVGTNGQHAYFQLLHQGTDVTPIDFIAALRPAHDLPGHHAALLANCFAQSEAFMSGKTADEVRADLQSQACRRRDRGLAPHKTFPGNRPSNTLLMDQLTPAALGALIALYEHKVFVQGVHVGRQQFRPVGRGTGQGAGEEYPGGTAWRIATGRHDGSTNGLIAKAKAAL